MAGSTSSWQSSHLQAPRESDDSDGATPKEGSADRDREKHPQKGRALADGHFPALVREGVNFGVPIPGNGLTRECNDGTADRDS